MNIHGVFTIVDFFAKCKASTPVFFYCMAHCKRNAACITISLHTIRSYAGCMQRIHYAVTPA